MLSGSIGKESSEYGWLWEAIFSKDEISNKKLAYKLMKYLCDSDFGSAKMKNLSLSLELIETFGLVQQVIGQVLVETLQFAEFEVKSAN